MHKINIRVIALLLLSCSYFPESQGRPDNIIIITSPEDKPFVKNIMENLFSYKIYTPQPELEFNLQYKNPWEIDQVKNYTNLIIASLDNPQDSTGDYLMRKLTLTNKINETLFILEDLYANNQVLFAVNGFDSTNLENQISFNKEWILKEFRDNYNNKMQINLFKNGKNISLSKKIGELFGYTIDLDIDYKIIKIDSLKPFIWTGRGYPYRWITIHKSNKDNYKYKYQLFDQLIYEFSNLLPEINISDYKKNIETIPYNKDLQYIIRGIYEHDESESGGPFFVYIFDTESLSEVILVSGFVNYPGHQKLELIKQLEILANTLHKGEN